MAKRKKGFRTGYLILSILFIFIIIIFLYFIYYFFPIIKIPSDIRLEKIKLPSGFKIDVYAQNVAGARSMALSEKGTLFVGSRDEGKVYAILDKNKDSFADEIIVLAENLNMPNGVAFKDGDLYVAEISKVRKYEDIENNLDNPSEPIIIKDDFPSDRLHGWKYIAIGPDEKLYVPVGAPCNACEKEEIYASLTRMNLDGSDFEIYAKGIRNTVGFTWHPLTNELWFTDNGRDLLGDDLPPDELNRAAEKGLNFGFPYCHAGEILDPEFGRNKNCDDFVKPVQKLGPHVASLGLKFYTGEMFPKEYQNQIFIAEHGSWNRSVPIGYRISLVKLDEDGKSLGYSVFAEGWLEGRSSWGRPVDLLIMPDGSMLVSDDKSGTIYRISYGGE